MTNYRRSDLAGASHLLSPNLAGRSQTLLIEHIESLPHSFEYTREHHPYTVDVIVILPEHIHAV